MFKNAYSTLKRGMKKSFYHYTLTPTDAIAFLTYRCTSRCVSCNIWKRDASTNDELTYEQWERILLNLKTNNVESIELFGGDALLRKDVLLKMIEYCSLNEIATFLPTNSNGLNEEIVKRLIDIGLGTIYFSVDETPDAKESVRGIDKHFERVKDGLELFVKLRGNRRKPLISCITTVSKANYQQLDTILKFAHTVGADEFLVRGISEFKQEIVEQSGVNGILPTPYFMSTDGKSRAFDGEHAERFLERINEIDQDRAKYAPMNIGLSSVNDLTPSDLNLLRYPNPTCLFATTQVVISPYGNVIPCLYFRNYHLGNLKNQDLADVWGNEKHRQFVKVQQKGDIPICDYCSIKCYHEPFSFALKETSFAAVRKLKRVVGSGEG